MAPDDNKVFDVMSPHRVSPSATARPVIVGHRPQMADPMVREQGAPITYDDTSNGYLTHGEANGYDTPVQAADQPQDYSAPPLPPEASPEEDYSNDALIQSVNQPQPMAPTHNATTSSGGGLMSSDMRSMPGRPMSPGGGSYGDTGMQDDLPLPMTMGPPAPRKKGKGLRNFIIILIILIGAYLAIDAGALGSSINLPFHVFKQTSDTVEPSTAAPITAAPTVTPPTVSAGFTAYSLAGTSISFNYPTAWGAPTATPELGFSKRGGTNKTDGTYAYLIAFATNKDVQIAVTSNKYLPPARTALYYDYLQWCVGTNDSTKFYKSSMKFTTDSTKVDTPSTVVCDQGPLTDATKVDTNTIVQLKTTDADGKTVLGDIYTKNLTDPILAVMRVKDILMTNADNVKTLLASVKITPSAAANTPSASSGN